MATTNEKKTKERVFPLDLEGPSEIRQTIDWSEAEVERYDQMLPRKGHLL